MGRYWVLQWVLYSEPDLPVPTLEEVQRDFDQGLETQQSDPALAGDHTAPEAIRVLEIREVAEGE